MRLTSLLRIDFFFQLKYGFYFLYAFLTAVYIVILYFIPNSFKKTALAIIIFTDPAALGLFFMGAIVMLEKSQRVLPSLAVSPIKIWEYILSKVLSLAFISTIVGIVIALSVGTDNILLIIAGTFLSSVLFSLIGIIIAVKSKNLNQFIIITSLIMLFIMLPPFFELFFGTYFLFSLNAANVALRLMLGKADYIILGFIVFFIWIAVFFIIAEKSFSKMLKEVGGVKL